MTHSTKLGLTQGVMLFGVMSAFATRDGYSPTYYKKAFGRKLDNLGRLSNAQGKPALRCKQGFLDSILTIARKIDKAETDTFMLDQSGNLIEEYWVPRPDFVRFVVMNNYTYAYSCQLSGVQYYIDGATMIALGGVAR